MAEIKKVLISIELTEKQRDALQKQLTDAELFFCSATNQTVISAALKEVDVAIISGDIDQRYLDAPFLRWVHCGHAGIEKSASAEVFEKSLIVTSSAGRSAQAIAEHAMFFMLSLAYKSEQFLKAQECEQWGIAEQHKLRALKGATLGILGLGHSGKAIAELGKAFKMKVLGYRRTKKNCRFVDRLYTEENNELYEFLSFCDYVVIALPLNDKTFHIIDSSAIAVMKKGVRIINVGRGAVINEVALIGALSKGQVAGAGLDVFETEPLPKKHPFWSMPNIVITPHVTPQLIDREERSLAIIKDNIDAYKQGLIMKNELCENDIYSHCSSVELIWKNQLYWLRVVRELLRRIRFSINILLKGY